MSSIRKTRCGLSPNTRVSPLWKAQAPGIGGHPAAVVIADSDGVFSRKIASSLRTAGFAAVTTKRDFSELAQSSADTDALLYVVDVSSALTFDSLYAALQLARFRGFGGRLVMLTDSIALADVYAAVSLKVSDIWIKTAALCIEQEVLHLFERERTVFRNLLNPEKVSSLGLFRTAGLSPMEIAMIQRMADGFHRQRDIAQQHHMSQVYVNKVFSRIYEKLGPVVHAETPAQLACLITVCSMFD